MKHYLILLLFTLVPAAVYGQTGKSHLNLNKNGLALGGYDAVAYQTQQKAIEGKSTYSYRYNDAVYYFASENNLLLFKKNPEKFLPAYGGWCAYAMGDSGDKVKVDPETFKIINGRLYLFYNFFFNNTLDSWNENETVLKRNADNNWNKIIHAK